MTTKTKDLNWVPYSVPLETAQKWVANWVDADPDQPLDPTDMRAFLVHRADFIELLAQHDTEFIRMYLGRRENKEGDIEPCLLLVSAARHGDVDPKAPDPDRIVDLVGKMPLETDEKNTEETYNVFDFTHACPPVCDPESPLFVGEADERCQ